MTTTGLIVSIVAAVAGIVALIWAHAQYRLGRRRQVRVGYSVSPLVRQTAGTADLEIRLRVSQTEVKAPHSTTLTLTALKPSDVPPEAFSSRPLQIDFQAPVVSLTSIGGHPEADLLVDLWRAGLATRAGTEPIETWAPVVELAPALLSVREPWSVTVVCEGEPTPQVVGQLTNVDFISAPEANRRTIRWLQAALAAAVLAGLLAVVVVVVLPTPVPLIVVTLVGASLASGLATWVVDRAVKALTNA